MKPAAFGLERERERNQPCRGCPLVELREKEGPVGSACTHACFWSIKILSAINVACIASTHQNASWLFAPADEPWGMASLLLLPAV
jgi:hypothetical protein